MNFQAAGGADTNGAVAGALLGCKLGYTHLTEHVPHWLFKMCHKDWFDKKVRRYLNMYNVITTIYLHCHKQHEIKGTNFLILRFMNIPIR